MAEQSKAIERTTTADDATLEDRLPQLLDGVLGELSAVGVDRILELAAAMVQARCEAPAEAHLEPAAAARN